jgi:hypothetical protein
VSKEAEGELGTSPYLAFFSLYYVMPGGQGFAGWIAIVLMIAALALGPRRTLAELNGDPRWILLAAGVLLFSLSILPEGTPGDRTASVVRGVDQADRPFNLYLFVSDLIPGVDVARGAGAIYTGVHVVICTLAGLGAAGVLRVVPSRWLPAASAALIAFAAADSLRPRVLGLSPVFEYTMVDLSPDPHARSLFLELAAANDTGPVLEYPVKHLNFHRSSKGVLLSAYHHRRTSYCYNSYMPSEARRVEELAAELPETSALDALHELGFETLVVHHAKGEIGGILKRQKIHELSLRPNDPRLREIAGNESITAYEILP